MKMLFFILFTALFCNTSFAQVPEKSIAKVQYTFTHIRDTTEPDKPYQENMVLIIGKNASRYLSQDAITEKDRWDKELKKQMEAQAGSNNITINRGRIKSLTRDEYFYFTKENKLIHEQHLMNTYLVELPSYTIDWNISKDTMSFEGIHCQKATAHFKGRNWIAWYATELPFQSGPWKLNGLPGLIISAHDDKNEVKFEFAGMEMIKDEPNENTVKNDTKEKFDGVSERLKKLRKDEYQDKEIKFPDNGIKTTKAEYDKLKEAYNKDREGFFNAQNNDPDLKITVTQTKISKSTSAPVKRRFNNPIELPEK